MSVSIKSPTDADGASATKGKGNNPRAKGSSGEYNGEPGNQYQKRTPSPNACAEKTYDGAKPKGNLDIKTPSTPAKK